MSKNKITTLSYFTKRLKDSGFNVWKICDNFSVADPRKWTVLIDPGNTSVFVTCYENREYKGDRLFEFDDGGRFFPRNFFIRTNSMEVIIIALTTRNIPQTPEATMVET
jgi:hypothetical protein